MLLSTRVYFLLCLFTRQFRIHEQVDAQIYLEYYVPVMTILQLICVMGWMKVAETILNPMGEDDDDFECRKKFNSNVFPTSESFQRQLHNRPESGHRADNGGLVLWPDAQPTS